MHENSVNLIRSFIDRELAHSGKINGDLLDVGSLDVNGTYRQFFPGWSYFGVDIREGPGVDMVVPDSCKWDLKRKFDVVICGQTLEHVCRPWVLMRTIGRHMKRGGLIYLSAPFCWPFHSHPRDFFRYTPAGLRMLAKEAGCKVMREERHNAGFTDHRSWYEESMVVGIRTS